MMTTLKIIGAILLSAVLLLMTADVARGDTTYVNTHYGNCGTGGYVITTYLTWGDACICWRSQYATYNQIWGRC